MAEDKADPTDAGATELGELRLAPLGAAGAYRLRQCRYGPMLFNRFDSYIGRSLDLYGEYCEPEANLLRSMLRPGDVIVEAGANIGAHTIAMARAVGEAGLVIAFEPQRLIYQLLCANIAINELANVQARQAGLGSAPGSVKLPVILPNQAYNFGGVGLVGHEDGEAVPIETIDAIGLTACRLIKADVEGMEREVLLGAEATVARCRPILYIENDRRDNSPSLLRLIMGWRYRVWWDLPPLFNPNNFAGNAADVFPKIRSANILCIPAEEPMGAQTTPIASPEDWPLKV